MMKKEHVMRELIEVGFETIVLHLIRVFQKKRKAPSHTEFWKVSDDKPGYFLSGPTIKLNYKAT